MPTRQQLESALRNADKAGDTSAAKQIANALKSGQFDDNQSGGELPWQQPDQQPATMGQMMDNPDQIPPMNQIIGPQAQAGFEPLRAVATGAIAEPVAGIAGIASLPYGTDRASQNVQAIREALTSTPEHRAGQQALQQFGQTISPINNTLQDLQKYLGEQGYQAAGPIGGAIAETLPTAAMMLGPSAIRGSLKAAGVAEKGLTSQAKSLLKEAAPSAESLKQTARGLYNELDNVGATINPRRINKLSAELQSVTKREGFNARIHPKVAAALDEFASNEGKNITVSELDTLRKVARAAAKSTEPDEARLGSIMVDKIDNTMDSLKAKDFQHVAPNDIGTKYKAARQLWSRSKKSELIQDAVERARNQASGFENGLRVQFRSILNNKKKIRGFNPDEKAALQKVVRGGALENTFKLLGKFGFSEGQASNILMSSLGVAGGAALGGPAGAVAIPLIGQVSKSLAQKLTRNNAAGADAIARAGNNGIDIAKAYLKVTPKAEQSVSDLTELLMRPDVSLDKLRVMKVPPGISNKKLIADSAFIASMIRSQQENQNVNQ